MTDYRQVCSQKEVEELNDSSSSTVLIYTTRVKRSSVGLAYDCSCPGWEYRGKCKHVTSMMERGIEPCDWQEGVSPEVQSPHQEMSCICPKCGSETEVVS